MTTLRNIWADLVEKRLWPVALLLLAGLIAVPVVLAGGGDEPSGGASAGAVAIAAKAATDDTEIVTLDVAPTVRRHDRRGRDPFVQPKGSTPEKAAALESATTGDGGGAAGPAAPAGDLAEPTKPAAVKKRKSSGPTYTVDLRFGQADSMKTLRDVTPFTALPSAQNPFFIYEGTKGGDGKTLIFTVSSDAKATGDGTCRPSAKECERIELKAGDTEFFDLTTGDGSTLQYQMDVIKVRKTAKGGTSAKAASAQLSPSDLARLRQALGAPADGAPPAGTSAD